jgi:hypothetical protein
LKIQTTKRNRKMEGGSKTAKLSRINVLYSGLILMELIQREKIVLKLKRL